jgi:hypothetical protein
MIAAVTSAPNGNVRHVQFIFRPGGYKFVRPLPFYSLVTQSVLTYFDRAACLV